MKQFKTDHIYLIKNITLSPQISPSVPLFLALSDSERSLSSVVLGGKDHRLSHHLTYDGIGCNCETLLQLLRHVKAA